MIKDQQKTLYKIIENSLKEDKLTHAYLLVGEQPLESAYWLAAVLMTRSLDDDMIQERITVFKDQSSIDFIFIDGQSSLIKKEDVFNLQVQFQKTAMETFNQKVVILHQAHLASLSALNSILKFVEEPQGQTTSFIFTSDSLEQILPTIQSRCMVITLDQVDKSDFNIDHKESLKVQYAMKISNNEEETHSHLSDQHFNDLFEFVEQFIQLLPKQPDLAFVLWQLKNYEQEDLSQFLSMICFILREGLYERTQPMIDINKDSQCYLVFNDMKAKLNPSTNCALLVDQGCYQLKEVLQ